MSANIPDKYNYNQFLVAYEELQFSSSKLNHKANNIPSNDNYHQILPSFLAVVLVCARKQPRSQDFNLGGGGGGGGGAEPHDHF